MVEGRLSKFYEDSCLLEQRFIMDDSRRVGEVVAAAAGGAGLEVESFLRVQVGLGGWEGQQCTVPVVLWTGEQHVPGTHSYAF